MNVCPGELRTEAGRVLLAPARTVLAAWDDGAGGARGC